MTIDGVDWPAPGDSYEDDKGRTLIVRAIQPKDRLERHVIGTLRELVPAHNVGKHLNHVVESDYACSLPTFRAIWREAGK